MIVRKTKIDFLKNSEEILREIEFSKFGNVRSFECINVEERLIRFKTLRKYRGHVFVFTLSAMLVWISATIPYFVTALPFQMPMNLLRNLHPASSFLPRLVFVFIPQKCA